jgi:hypothetical protein
MRKYSKSKGTPSLAAGQSWKPRTGDPYRPHLAGATSFVPERDVQAEWATGWHDPVKNAKAARVKNAKPR